MTELANYIDIASLFGKKAEVDEENVAMQVFKDNTNFNQGFVTVPEANSPDFNRISRDTLAGVDNLKEIVAGIFPETDQKDYLVLTEEEIANPSGITKYNRKDFSQYVLPLLINPNNMTNYWITDNANNCLTYHHDGYFYWKKPGKFVMKGHEK